MPGMIRPRFSLRTFFVTITLLVVVFLWHFKSTRDQQRLICDQAIATELSNIHWKALDSDSRFQTFNSTLASTFDVQSPCSTTFLLLSGNFSNGATADSFEQGLLADWSKPI